ncbi:MAG: hypothetical protein AAF996_06145 [Pseudomonadota bacterium]
MTIWKMALLAAIAAIATPIYAHAYIGPGVGIGAILLTIAVALGVLLLIFGLVWYPAKRLIAHLRAKKPS